MSVPPQTCVMRIRAGSCRLRIAQCRRRGDCHAHGVRHPAQRDRRSAGCAADASWRTDACASARGHGDGRRPGRAGRAAWRSRRRGSRTTTELVGRSCRRDLSRRRRTSQARVPRHVRMSPRVMSGVASVEPQLVDLRLLDLAGEVDVERPSTRCRRRARRCRRRGARCRCPSCRRTAAGSRRRSCPR